MENQQNTDQSCWTTVTTNSRGTDEHFQKMGMAQHDVLTGVSRILELGVSSAQRAEALEDGVADAFALIKRSLTLFEAVRTDPDNVNTPDQIVQHVRKLDEEVVKMLQLLHPRYKLTKLDLGEY